MAQNKNQTPHAQFGASPIPLYIQLADEFRQRIAQEQWRNGDMLPTIKELMQNYSVSRVTIRLAIKLLSDEGMLSAQRGRGTFVTAEVEGRRPLRVDTSLYDLVEMYRGDKPDHSNLSEGTKLPPVPKDGGILASKYFHMRRIHSRDGVKYCVISLYIEDKVFKKAPTKFRRELVLPVLVSIRNLVIAEARQTLKISKADVETANLLGIPVGEPIADVRRILTGTDGTIIYFADVTYRGDYIHLDIDLKP